MVKLIGFSRGKYYIYLDDIPLVGHIAFGVIDRCTNVLQIRPITVCPYNCIYCSVDAGPFSMYRLSEFIVDARHLIKWVKNVYDVKSGEVIEGLIDGVGEPPLHPRIVEIVNELKKIMPRVAIETRGYTLTKKLVNELAMAGLDRLNISIDTLNTEKGKYLQGVEWYNVNYVMKIIEYIVRETSIDVHLTPVWIPGINDE
ncbi:MAG: radical SAM protein, partial [Ignisphaera sp.]